MGIRSFFGVLSAGVLGDVHFSVHLIFSSFLLLFLLLLGDNVPVVLVVPFVARFDKEVLEKGLKVAVIRLIFELEVSAIRKISDKFVGESLAKDFDGSAELLLHNLLILFLLVVGLHVLPGERSSQEIEEDIAQRFKIVSSGLLNTKMGIDTGISSGTSQTLTLSVGDMLAILADVSLSKTEIDDIHLVLLLALADDEVIGLDISVEDVSGVNVFDSRKHLLTDHENSLQ